MNENNPYIEPENYYQGYQDSINKLKDRPDVVEFDKLCHLVFYSPDGKMLMDAIQKRFIEPSLASPASPQYPTLVIFMEGFKEALRTLKHCALSHEQRIKAEIK
jgi:hypothetical protein